MNLKKKNEYISIVMKWNTNHLRVWSEYVDDLQKPLN